MKTFTCNNFVGFYPVGSAAVVEAPTKKKAAERLNKTLAEMGLPGGVNPEDMVRFPSKGVTVRILCDGNY